MIRVAIYQNFVVLLFSNLQQYEKIGARDDDNTTKGQPAVFHRCLKSITTNPQRQNTFGSVCRMTDLFLGSTHIRVCSLLYCKWSCRKIQTFCYCIYWMDGLGLAILIQKSDPTHPSILPSTLLEIDRNLISVLQSVKSYVWLTLRIKFHKFRVPPPKASRRNPFHKNKIQ